MFSIRHTAIAGILAIAAVPALSAGTLSAGDTTFAKTAAMGGLAEVQAAHLAEQKASSADVKQFARQMDKDHTEANEALKQLAASKALTLPAEPDSPHATELRRLSQTSGAKFDQQYMQEQVADHKTTVALFQQEANSGQDLQLKEFAQKYLPILQHHLQMAEAIKVGS